MLAIWPPGVVRRHAQWDDGKQTAPEALIKVSNLLVPLKPQCTHCLQALTTSTHSAFKPKLLKVLCKATSEAEHGDDNRSRPNAEFEAMPKVLVFVKGVGVIGVVRRIDRQTTDRVQISPLEVGRAVLNFGGQDLVKSSSKQ